MKKLSNAKLEYQVLICDKDVKSKLFNVDAIIYNDNPKQDEQSKYIYAPGNIGSIASIKQKLQIEVRGNRQICNNKCRL